MQRIIFICELDQHDGKLCEKEIWVSIPILFLEKSTRGRSYLDSYFSSL